MKKLLGPGRIVRPGNAHAHVVADSELVGSRRDCQTAGHAAESKRAGEEG
jgi:hypothetical protein